MKILLCGAADVQNVLPQFNQLIVDEIGFESNSYIDGTIRAHNANDWTQNSIEAVERASIIVFVLISTAGEITWNTEYITAIKLGKPYILLCEEKLEQHFWMARSPGISVSSAHPFNEASKILDTLISQKRTIIKFSMAKADFKSVLRKQLFFELERAVELLQLANRKRSLLFVIRSKDYKSSIFDDITAEKIDYFEELLFDEFENKELRKRALFFFTVHKSLSDEQIVSLFKDREQGLYRSSIESLPSLVRSSSNLDFIFNELIKSLKDSDDTGSLRRAIDSLLNIDTLLGVKYVSELLPARDIGTPKRILTWLIDNYAGRIKPNLSGELQETLRSLTKVCADYQVKPENLKNLSQTMLELLDSEDSQKEL